jgi:hypothetical protein
MLSPSIMYLSVSPSPPVLVFPEPHPHTTFLCRQISGEFPTDFMAGLDGVSGRPMVLVNLSSHSSHTFDSINCRTDAWYRSKKKSPFSVYGKSRFTLGA